jgi:hypothetical protein
VRLILTVCLQKEDEDKKGGEQIRNASMTTMRRGNKRRRKTELIESDNEGSDKENTATPSTTSSPPSKRPRVHNRRSSMADSSNDVLSLLKEDISRHAMFEQEMKNLVATSIADARSDRKELLELIREQLGN